MRRRSLVGLAAVAVAATSCLGPRATERRGPVDLREPFGAYIDADGRSLSVEVPSCNGDPFVQTLQQDADEVRIEVVTTVQLRGGNDCLDGVQVVLDAPLGDRPLVDLTSGRTLPVERGD